MNKKLLSMVGSNSKTSEAMNKELGIIDMSKIKLPEDILGSINTTTIKLNKLEDINLYEEVNIDEIILDDTVNNDEKIKSKKLDNLSINDALDSNIRTLDDINVYYNED